MQLNKHNYINVRFFSKLVMVNVLVHTYTVYSVSSSLLQLSTWLSDTFFVLFAFILLGPRKLKPGQHRITKDSISIYITLLAHADVGQVTTTNTLHFLLPWPLLYRNKLFALLQCNV